MADFARKEGKRRDDRGLGNVVDFLLANARVVLGVSGAAVLAIATLAVKRVRFGRFFLACRRAPIRATPLGGVCVFLTSRAAHLPIFLFPLMSVSLFPPLNSDGYI